jgi:hypothetical protein
MNRINCLYEFEGVDTVNAIAAKKTRSTARKPATVAAKPAAPRPTGKKAVRRPAQPALPPAPSTPAAPAMAAKADKAPKAVKAIKPEKHRVKLVRDSFAMPEADFALIELLKARAIAAKRPAKKSELLRAGLKALTALTPAQLGLALEALMPIKTGRPKKGH